MPDHAQLTGPVVAFPETERHIDSLKKENRQLNQRVSDLEIEVAKHKNEAKRAQNALTALQNALSPVHRALRMVFGEIEAAGIDEAPDFGIPGAGQPFHAPAPHGPQDVKWRPWIEKWKGTKKAVVIETLLEHGPLTRTQLRSATESGWSTIDAVTAQLQNLGLISKENEKWTLKN